MSNLLLCLKLNNSNYDYNKYIKKKSYKELEIYKALEKSSKFKEKYLVDLIIYYVIKLEYIELLLNYHKCQIPYNFFQFVNVSRHNLDRKTRPSELFLYNYEKEIEKVNKEREIILW